MIHREEINRVKKNRQYLLGFSIIVIPVYTFLFGTQYSPFQYTFSMIANHFNERTEFMIWGIGTSILLGLYIRRLYKIVAFDNKRALKLLTLSNIALILTVVLPSARNMPVMHRLHSILGILFGLSTVATLYLFMKFLVQQNRKAFNHSIWFLKAVVGGSLLLLFLFGMTGVFELFYFSSLTLVLLMLNRRVVMNQSSLFNSERRDA